MRTYWIWNDGDENKNLPNITLIKRKNLHEVIERRKKMPNKCFDNNLSKEW